MNQLKYSRQREAIKEYLMSTDSHPSADEVYRVVREEYPKISLGTVYRNLTLLVENGDAIKISTDDGTDRFDGDTSPHSHYYCRCCHRLFDIDMAPTIDKVLAASSTGIGTIERANLLFTGRCNKCMDSSEN